MGCSVAADGQIMVDEDELDDFGNFKCSLCQRRFEEQGKNHIYLFDTSVMCIYKTIRRGIVRGRERDRTKLTKIRDAKTSQVDIRCCFLYSISIFAVVL